MTGRRWTGPTCCGSDKTDPHWNRQKFRGEKQKHESNRGKLESQKIDSELPSESNPINACSELGIARFESHGLNYRRGIGVRVKGFTGRDAIVHKRRRNSSQKGNAIVLIKSWLPSNSPCFSGFEAQLLRAKLLRNYCVTSRDPFYSDPNTPPWKISREGSDSSGLYHVGNEPQA